MERMEAEILRMKSEMTMIPDNSVDVIVSNCVLNLVSDSKKKQLFAEMFRVLKVGGRVAVSDIISDEDSPEELKKDARCITVDKFEDDPWQIVEGIEYRSATYLAYKGKQGECLEKNQAVIYKGPWSHIKDDDGHVFIRGERSAVCEKTFNLLQQEPYAGMFYTVEPSIPVTDRIMWPAEDCGVRRRDPQDQAKKVVVAKTQNFWLCIGMPHRACYISSLRPRCYS